MRTVTNALHQSKAIVVVTVGLAGLVMWPTLAIRNTKGQRKGKTMSMAGEIENSEHAIKEIQAELQSLVDKIERLQFLLGVEQLRLEQLKKASKG